MSKGTIVALGIGIIIGAAGMWFIDESKEPSYQVDEIIEGYSMPSSSTPSETTPKNAPEMGGQAPAAGQNMDTTHMDQTGTEQTQAQ